MGASKPVTFGPEEMGRLRDIVIAGDFGYEAGGGYEFVADFPARYIADLTARPKFKRKLRVVAACGNGTAGAFAPKLLGALGVEVVPLDCDLDFTFPRYNPNPEDMQMLHAMAGGGGSDRRRSRTATATAAASSTTRATRSLLTRSESCWRATSREGGRTRLSSSTSSRPDCSRPIPSFAPMASRLTSGRPAIRTSSAGSGTSRRSPASRSPAISFFFADRTRLRRRLRHRDRHPRHTGPNPGKSMADLYDLPRTWASPTMSPHCADEAKYAVADRVVERFKAMRARGEPLAGQPIRDLITVNGVRVTVEDGAWGLVRASSNKPELVEVVESPASEAGMRAMFDFVDRVLRENPEVGAYNQTI